VEVLSVGDTSSASTGVVTLTKVVNKATANQFGSVGTIGNTGNTNKHFTRFIIEFIIGPVLLFSPL